MINICIESFKLLLHEIKQSENKNSFIIIIIHKDPFLSKGVSNEEMDSRVITFAGALRQALANCVHLNAELLSCAAGN